MTVDVRVKTDWDEESLAYLHLEKDFIASLEQLSHWKHEEWLGSLRFRSIVPSVDAERNEWITARIISPLRIVKWEDQKCERIAWWRKFSFLTFDNRENFCSAFLGDRRETGDFGKGSLRLELQKTSAV
jgi:hypothetical protein